MPGGSGPFHTVCGMWGPTQWGWGCTASLGRGPIMHCGGHGVTRVQAARHPHPHMAQPCGSQLGPAGLCLGSHPMTQSPQFTE